MAQDHTVLVLAGPTASGKTAHALRLAHALDCEIVCMDSMQIYRGLDIGTAKPTLVEMDQIPHHMLDVADPRESFSVAQYQAMAEDVLRGILSRGKRPLMVGGTGLYLRAMRHPLALGQTAADPAVREAMQKRLDEPGGREKLHEELARVDPVTANRLPLGDVRRVIRALEVWQLTGKPFSEQPQKEESPPFTYRVATLDMDRALLYDRIEKRVDRMMEAGLPDEVKRLLDSGVPEDAQAMKALGYKEMIPYLQGRCGRAQAVDALKQGTRHYAKRQLTWMRREEDVLWVDSLAPDAEDKLMRWYTQGD